MSCVTEYPFGPLGSAALAVSMPTLSLHCGSSVRGREGLESVQAPGAAAALLCYLHCFGHKYKQHRWAARRKINSRQPGAACPALLFSLGCYKQQNLNALGGHIPLVLQYSGGWSSCSDGSEGTRFPTTAGFYERNVFYCYC